MCRTVRYEITCQHRLHLPISKDSTIRTFQKFPVRPDWIRKLNLTPIGSLADASGLARDLRRRYKKDLTFSRFDEIIQSWITDWRRCRGLKEEAWDWLRSQGGSEDCKLLMRVLAHTEPDAPELYRGEGPNGTVWTLLQQYAPGVVFDLALASFSSSRDWADEFARIDAEDVGRTEVVFVLRSGSQALRIEALAPDYVHWREREWYTGGRFLVIDSRVVGENQVEVTLEQSIRYHV